jgi:hypothetical protein
MSITLTQLAVDNFTRASINPLQAPWAIDTHGDPGLQITSDVCEPTVTSGANGQIYEYSGGAPADQYASVTVASLSSNGAVDLFVRLTDNGSSLVNLPGYRFTFGGDGSWELFTPVGGLLLSGTGLTISVGDVFTIAAVSTTIYLFHNGTQLGSLTDTTYASGSVALGASPFSTPSSVELSNFAMGSAAFVDPPTINTTSLPNGTIGVPYSQQLAATGGVTPYTWSIASGALPNGLTLNSSTGVISGTPTVGGNFSFTVQCADSQSPPQAGTSGSLGIDVVAGGGGSWSEYSKVVQRPQQPARGFVNDKAYKKY